MSHAGKIDSDSHDWFWLVNQAGGWAQLACALLISRLICFRKKTIILPYDCDCDQCCHFDESRDYEECCDCDECCDY